MMRSARHSLFGQWPMHQSILVATFTKLDSFARQLLSNDEVIAVDQSGHPAKQCSAASNPSGYQVSDTIPTT